MTSRAGAIILLLAVVVAAPGQPALKSGLDVASFDTSVRPQDDLFRYVNGGWLANTPMPPDRVTYGTFMELADKTEADLRVIIEEVAATREKQRGTARQIADLYTSLMNQAHTNELGIKPIRGDLQKIDAIKSPRDLAGVSGYLSAIALGGPFLGTVEEDVSNAGRPLVSVAQGGTMLPDRDYYLKADESLVRIRAQYVDYLAAIFRLVDRPDARSEAEAVLALETAVARLQVTQEEARDPARTAKKYSLADLQREMPGFDWSAWAKPQGIDVTGSVVLAQPSFFKGFAALVPDVPIESWNAWLRARFLTSCAPYLTQAFSDARFEFFGRVLSGQELPRTHWKRGVGLVTTFLGDAVGRLYVEKHLPQASKERADTLVATLIAAFREAIAEAGWMSERTRKSALDKLSKLAVKVGYPNRWRDYRRLVIKPDDLFGNFQRARQFDGDHKLARLSRPWDRGEWLMTPQTANAYYGPGLNEIVVPAALLQPPLFNVEADDAVNYGALGAAIGHELGHGFDEYGRRFDGTGQIRNWWTVGDEQAFDALARRLIEQYNSYSPLPGAHVNGALTLRENIGDLSGLAIAWRAYQIALGGKKPPVIDGFSGEQRFFLGWAQAQRGRIREEYLQQTLLWSPHAPPQYRANGPASNIPAFYDAFSVKPGDRMYRDADKRVRIW